jgi:hypothetical protein
MKKADSALPLSAISYAVIAALGLIFAAGFTLFYIYRVPTLVASGAQGQVFYVLLIPWALSCAFFLFGAMKSYARFTYKHLGSFLELGGPVVLFCLVLVGGFKLVPTPPETFDLTVRAHSADGRDPIITSGKITIDLDNDRRTASLGTNGEADFKGIPPKFRGATLKILPQVDGYEEQWQRHKLKTNVLDLPLVRAALPVTILTGTITPPPGTGKSIKILVEGQKREGSPDGLGRFELSVNGKAGDRVRLRVYSDGKMVYDDYQVLPGPVTLSLHKPDIMPTTNNPIHKPETKKPSAGQSESPPVGVPSPSITQNCPGGICAGGNISGNPTIINPSPIQRHLLPEFITETSACLSQKKGTVNIGTIAGNVEAWKYAQDWYAMFHAAGWTIKDNVIHTFIPVGGMASGTTGSILGTWDAAKKQATYDHDSAEGQFTTCMLGKLFPGDTVAVTPYPDMAKDTVTIMIYPPPSN